MIAGVVAVGLLSPDYTSPDLYFPVIIVVLCWLGGRTVQTRARHAAELHETAALAAERREREAQAAVGEERRRIAREMHDVVAHSISVMVVQAGGARRILAGDPERAEEAARRIRAAGTDALAEMHILLGVLESAPDGAAPPTLDGLDTRRAHPRRRPAGLARGQRRAPLAQPRCPARRLPRRAGGAHQRHEARGQRHDVRALHVGRGRARAHCRRPRRRRPEPQLAGAGHGLRACASGCGSRRRGADGAAAGRRLRGRRAATARARDGGLA